MFVGILKESGSENRVAMLPGEAASLRKLGVEVMVESGAGNRAFKIGRASCRERL